MKRLAKRDSTAVSGPRRASPSQSWPGFFFRQRADLSFEWITREVEKLFSATAKSRLASPAQFWAMVHPADLETLRQQIQSCAKSRQWLTHTFRLRQAGGQVIYISESRRALRDGGAKLCGYEGFWIDITRQTFAEARLLQSVWKETLGDLTPGLAHDFNNVLTGILTLSEAFLAQIDSKHTFHEGLSLIKQKALEASRLTQRIARLHQEKTGRRSYQDVNSTVTEVLELLGKVITKRYELRTTLAGESLPVFVDAVEFRRVLLSLALAAINNKSNSGGLHFHTSRHDTPPLPVPGKGKLARRPVIGVRLIASSSIISPEQLEMLLDPRAAAIEEIAGMALSLRHASLFLEQSNGAISVESKRKTGTTIGLWLPQADFTEE